MMALPEKDLSDGLWLKTATAGHVAVRTSKPQVPAVDPPPRWEEDSFAGGAPTPSRPFVSPLRQHVKGITSRDGA